MRPISFLLAPLALASLASGCGHDPPSVPTSAIAVVGDRPISRSQYEALMAEARQSYATGSRPFPAAGTDAYRHLSRLAVDLLVEQAELEQEAPRLGVQVDRAQVEAKLRQLKDQSFGGSERRYRARLRAAGMTDAQVRSALRAQLLVDAVRAAVTADVTVPTQAVQQYYERHLRDYTTPQSRVVRHLLVRTKAQADRIVAALRSGASFATLARRYSRDPQTRGRGGELTLVAGRTSPALDGVAFELAVGQVSRPFRTSFGWELVQPVSPVRLRRTRPFEAVRNGIRRRLLAQRRAQFFQTWLGGVHSRFADRTAFATGFAPTDRR